MKSVENVFEFLNCQHENIKLTVEKKRSKHICERFCKDIDINIASLISLLYRIYERMKFHIYSHLQENPLC